MAPFSALTTMQQQHTTKTVRWADIHGLTGCYAAADDARAKAAAAAADADAAARVAARVADAEAEAAAMTREAAASSHPAHPSRGWVGRVGTGTCVRC